MPTKDMEFFDPLASDSGFEWQPAPGYDEGGTELVLYEDPDGGQTRLLRLEPGPDLYPTLLRNLATSLAGCLTVQG